MMLYYYTKVFNIILLYFHSRAIHTASTRRYLGGVTDKEYILEPILSSMLSR